MDKKNFKLISFLIAISIFLVLAVQVYRNYKSYLFEEKNFKVSVEKALDKSIKKAGGVKGVNFVRADALIAEKNAFPLDSLSLLETNDPEKEKFSLNKEKLFKNNKLTSVKLKRAQNYDAQLKSMASKFIFSLIKDSISLKVIGAFLEEELAEEKININYKIKLFKGDSLQATFLKGKEIEEYPFSVSKVISLSESLDLEFESSLSFILREGSLEIAVSLFVLIVIISVLVYLQKVINEQKELSEIKNNLISNITHEFKTPIATISTALEGVTSFNKENDPQKNKKYLGISMDQLKRLTKMVEKLLETSMLNSQKLELQKEEVDIVHLVKNVFEQFKRRESNKEIHFTTNTEKETFLLDPFHIESVISNLLDNAIKYGGDTINVRIDSMDQKLVCIVSDSGGKISKKDQKLIFDKFYRVSTGNIHAVKGFGIGLYYTKYVIEQHGASIELKVSSGLTEFLIHFPKNV